MEEKLLRVRKEERYPHRTRMQPNHVKRWKPISPCCTSLDCKRQKVGGIPSLLRCKGSYLFQ